MYTKKNYIYNHSYLTTVYIKIKKLKNVLYTLKIKIKI